MPRNTTSSRCVLNKRQGITLIGMNMKLSILDNHLQGQTHLTAFGSGS